MNLLGLLIKILPPRLRHELIRSKFKLSYDLPDNLEICVADNRQDFEASLNLVYRYYCKLGYCEENRHQMRATLHHALPTTTTIVAKVDQIVVGALTIVRDNRLGLPIEKVGSLDEYRKGGVRLAEITSLVIDKKYRRAEGGGTVFCFRC